MLPRKRKRYIISIGLFEHAGGPILSFDQGFQIKTADPHDPLVPVMTFLPRVASRDRLNAFLSFLEVTRDDYCRNTLLPHPISATDEIAFIKTFFGFLEVYEKLDSWRSPLFSSLLETAHTIINSSPAENSVFLQNRFKTICAGQDGYACYWKALEGAPLSRIKNEYTTASLTIPESKGIADFCLLLVFLALWYGGGGLIRKTIGRTVERFRKKYRNEGMLKEVAIFLLSIDFAFIRDEKPQRKNATELSAITAALKTINPASLIQPLYEGRAWARDAFAWLDTDFHLLLQHKGPLQATDKGALHEGGNIVPAGAKTRFILLSQEAAAEGQVAADFILALKNRGIDTYTLPGGFTRARNTATGRDTLLDSTHIDTVINVIPGIHTSTDRPQIIVDPYYYEMIRDNNEFMRLQKEQDISGSDIVIIDKSEAHLNLANFAILCAKNGAQRILFNKDRGSTLPRLKLKKKNLAQPAIEITGIAAFNGGLRCITNMFPRSQVQKAPLSVSPVYQNTPEETKTAVSALFARKKNLLAALSSAWVASLQIRGGFKKNTYEFDDLTRTLSVGIDQKTSMAPRRSCDFIEKCIAQACQKIRKHNGIV